MLNKIGGRTRIIESIELIWNLNPFNTLHRIYHDSNSSQSSYIILTQPSLAFFSHYSSLAFLTLSCGGVIGAGCPCPPRPEGVIGGTPTGVPGNASGFTTGVWGLRLVGSKLLIRTVFLVGKVPYFTNLPTPLNSQGLLFFWVISHQQNLT